MSAHLCPALCPALLPATAAIGSAHRYARMHKRSRARTDWADKGTKERCWLESENRRQGASRGRALRTGSVEREVGGAAASAAGAHGGGECRTVLCRAKLHLLPPHFSLSTLSRVLGSSSGGCDGTSCGCARAVTRRDPCSGLKIRSRCCRSDGRSAEEAA